MSMLQAFKKFALKGNMVDMAVGIVVGVAFGKIVSSLVGDVIMPPLGMMIGGVNFTTLSFVIKEASGELPAVSIGYGKFLQSVFDFTIIAFVIFMVVRAMNAMKKAEIKEAAVALALSKEAVLLTEIRDLLKNKS